VKEPGPKDCERAHDVFCAVVESPSVWDGSGGKVKAYLFSRQCQSLARSKYRKICSCKDALGGFLPQAPPTRIPGEGKGTGGAEGKIIQSSFLPEV